MLNLLSIEYSKVKNYTTFWVMLIIYASLIPVIIWGISVFHFGQEETPMYWEGSSIFKFPVVWNGVTWVASWFNLLLGILIVLIICNDFNYRTFKQNVIDGLSKQQVIASKFLFLIALALVVTLYTFLLGTIFGFAFSDGVDMLDDIYYIGIYFIQTIGYFTMAFLLAILIKRPALSIIIYAVVIIFKFIFYFVLGSTISQFIPMNIFAGLTPFPILQDQIAMMDAQQQAEYAIIISQSIRTIVAITYIGIFLFISNYILKKRDL